MQQSDLNAKDKKMYEYRNLETIFMTTIIIILCHTFLSHPNGSYSQTTEDILDLALRGTQHTVVTFMDRRHHHTTTCTDTQTPQTVNHHRDRFICLGLPSSPTTTTDSSPSSSSSSSSLLENTHQDQNKNYIRNWAYFLCTYEGSPLFKMKLLHWL